MDPNQMMMPRPRSFPMWPPPPPTSSDAMPPPQLPFLPPPNRGWKRKNPNPNSNSAAYQPPAIGDLQVQNRAKARRWFKPNPNSNRRPFFHKPKAKAPRNTSSFIIRAKRAGGIAPLVSPSPVTPAVLPTPVISPAHDERLLSDVLAQQQWGVDGYGSMKGLIRLRPANHAPSSSSDDDDSSGGSDVEEHVEVERRLDHDLSRFEMVYPQPGAVFEDDDELYDQNQDDDVDVHVARLEEENLTLKERLFLMEQEVGDMRRRLEAIEARFSDGAAVAAAAAAAVENVTEVGNAIAAAGADDAVEQALENGTERGDANADAVEVVALQNGTGSGAAGAVNHTVEEALKNDTEMGDATADADNTFEDSTEKGDASDNGRANKSLENGSVEPEKSGKEEESYSAGSEKNAEIGDAASAQGNGQEA
ncbi:uncharacterized protein LOC124666249 [Lolium rigidum]|uniref:uncharacterized protein LOC124666249 n=1 Tax=Lolium rigidum TaxID=89674 RepID=UPI001F5C298F|nr:uncharacterized protein LOC124666249 [Lolium rigidum]